MKSAARVVLALVISAATAGVDWQACAGWFESPGARHACCKATLTKLGPDTSAKCCAIGQQSRDRSPIRSTYVPAAPATAPEPVPAVHLHDAACQTFIHARGSLPASPPAPLYVQHHSLLI